MKTLYHFLLKHQFLMLIGFCCFLPFPGHSAEFVIINDTIEYPNSTDDNGFYFFYYNASMPSNWKTPVDYYNGQVYTRYEIITQATSEPVGLQFGIWQKLPPVTGTLYENMEDIRTLNGPGSFVTSNSNPATWWTFNGGADFTQMNLVWHFGINPYKLTPTAQQIRSENASVWAERFTYWFPMTVRVTIVAVSYDDTFSGWDYYTKFATPAYTINYSTEKTTQIVPSTDEYSYSATMSPAYNGTGVALDLEPGQNVYFRTKARDNAPASDIQQLTVPSRPAISSYSIDFANVRTNEVVAASIVYSTSSDFTSPTNGTGAQLSVTPGQDLYLRVNPTASSFASETIHLVVPSRPAAPSASIDYQNVNTNEVFASSVEYSTNASMSGAITCSNAKVDVTPGTDLYFRVKSTGSSFPSLITTLDVPSRPATPTITINYTAGTTSVVGSSIEWSVDESMSTTTQGENAAIPLTPGTDVYFRVKATSSTFASAIQHLVVPIRPMTPHITINYSTEASSVILSIYEWSLSESMSSPTQGQDVALTLTPGTDLFIRVKATTFAFASAIQHLVVPSRPTAPVFSINYGDKTTNEVVSSNIEYSEFANFSTVSYGSGDVLELTPGTDLYLRQKNTTTSFRSATFVLTVPEAGILGYSGNDTVSSAFMMYAIIADETYEFTLNSLAVVNGIAENLREGNIFDIQPLTMGDVEVKISASNNGFESNVVKVYYDGPTSISPITSDLNIKIYPNPSNNGVVHIGTDTELPYSIDIISADGKLLRKIERCAIENNEINIGELGSGIYFLKICLSDQISIQKLILE